MISSQVIVPGLWDRAVSGFVLGHRACLRFSFLSKKKKKLTKSLPTLPCQSLGVTAAFPVSAPPWDWSGQGPLVSSGLLRPASTQPQCSAPARLPESCFPYSNPARWSASTHATQHLSGDKVGEPHRRKDLPQAVWLQLSEDWLTFHWVVKRLSPLSPPTARCRLQKGFELFPSLFPLLTKARRPWLTFAEPTRQ